MTSGAIASHFKISRETVLDKIRLMENEGIVYRGNQLRIGGVLWSIKKTKTKNEIVFDVLEKYGTMKKTAISAMCGISKRNIEEILKNLYSTGLISIEKKLQNGRTINFYSIKNKLAEIQFPQDKPARKKKRDIEMRHMQQSRAGSLGRNLKLFGKAVDPAARRFECGAHRMMGRQLRFNLSRTHDG